MQDIYGDAHIKQLSMRLFKLIHKAAPAYFILIVTVFMWLLMNETIPHCFVFFYIRKQIQKL